MHTKNLNNLLIENADGAAEPLVDYFAISEDAQTKALFKNLEAELIRRIEQADVVIGCVAWLTNEAILRALSEKVGVSIIVQKEDFLRPDLGSKSGWNRRLRRLYDDVPSTLSRYDKGLQGTALHMMSFANDPTIQSIRCVGNHNSAKDAAFPRAHHKFVVFCKTLAGDIHEGDYDYQPYEVWTGSYNFTKNAGSSFENAIVSKDKNIVEAFRKEFGQIAALSEPLDWNSTWTAPEWRIGT
jgi:phosphatidylserine/phosphatidylglycerophosphate/cardiolipin synthase-like enzyme